MAFRVGLQGNQMTDKIQGYSRVTEVTPILPRNPDKTEKEKKKNSDFARLLSAALEKDKKTLTNDPVS